MRILILISCTILTSCSSLHFKQDNFEELLFTCVDSIYNSIGIDYKQELLAFEKHLIESGQLENSNGESYHKIFEIIVENGQVPIKTDYVIDKFTFDDSVIHYECLYSQFDNPKFYNSDSKLLDLYRELSKLSNSGDINLKSTAQAMIDVLDADDFEKELYKFFSLHTLYYAASISRLRSFDDTKIIEISISENHEVFVDGEKVESDSIANKIIRITSEFTKEEKENYRIRFNVNENVKINVVNDVKFQLRKANASRIDYGVK